MNNFLYTNYSYPGEYIAIAKSESGYWCKNDQTKLQNAISQVSLEVKALTSSLNDLASAFDKMQQNMNSSDWANSAVSITNGVEQSSQEIITVTGNLLNSLEACLSSIASSHTELSGRIDSTLGNLQAALSRINSK